MMLRKSVLWLMVLVIALTAALAAAQSDATWQLTIMHTNDTHANHDPLSSGSGGVTRQAAVVEQIRAQADNSLLLESGDRFTGTLFHAQYLGQDQALIMNLMGYDAMSLGNHEFDNGDDILAAFIDAVDFPVLAANVDFSASPHLAGKVAPYAVLDVNGEQVGVIGLLTADTTNKSRPGAELVFSDDYSGIAQQYVDELTGMGVNKIILLTHLGLGLDMRVASEVSGVDVIVGGDSHTLLSNMYAAAEDSYPVVVESPDGQPVYIVQAGDQNEFLGRLNVTFDAAGVITRASGDIILLSQFITPNADMDDLVEELREPLTALLEQEVGASAVAMDNGTCRNEECTIGNLIADAVRQETGVQIVFLNGGGIRAGIDEGVVTLGEVRTVLPFGNLVSTFELSGADVVAALENGVSRVNDERGGTGRFPQVSGLRYTWDLSQEVGSRIVSVDVLNAETGEYAPIDPEAMYRVAANDFMRSGGDEYYVFRDNAVNAYDFGRPLDTVVIEYFGANSPVHPQLEGRITNVAE